MNRFAHLLVPPPGPRVVFDTNVVLQAALSSGGPAGKCLMLMEQNRINVFVSNAVRHEYEDTLYDVALRAKITRLTDSVAQAVLARLDTVALRLDAVPARFFYARDPDDEPFLNLAIHVQAQYLLTRDRDLLDLNGNAELLALAPDLQIVAPPDFLLAMG